MFIISELLPIFRFKSVFGNCLEKRIGKKIFSADFFSLFQHSFRSITRQILIFSSLISQ